MANDLSGFVKSTGDAKRRLIISLSGPEKTGKTHFALTAPGPIALIDFDTGLEGVVHRFKDKHVFVSEYRMGMTLTADTYLPTWEKMKKDYATALGSKNIRTVVIDTATEAWELCRLRFFGKLTQVMPHHYSAPNAEYRELIRAAFSSDKNVILLHKVKAEYVNDKTTGKMVRAGFNDTGFLVQMNLRTSYNTDDGFITTVKDCRQNMDIAGLDLMGDMNNFPVLGTLVFPGTSVEEWV